MVDGTNNDGHVGSGAERDGSSSDRVLSILSLFTIEVPEWSIEEIASSLKLTRTTAYRYAKTLVDAGLLASINTGTYVLGPRLIELDRQIRLSDPMLRAALPIMASIRNLADGMQQLVAYYGDRVMCVHHDATYPGIDATVERGRPFPLFVGASRVILANLPTRQLQRFMLNHAAEIARVGLGENWQQFSKKMRSIRQAGYYAAIGEVDSDNFGVSAPIMHSKGVTGCLRIARPVARLRDADIQGLIELTTDAAARISASIQAREKPNAERESTPKLDVRIIHNTG